MGCCVSVWHDGWAVVFLCGMMDGLLCFCVA